MGLLRFHQLLIILGILFASFFSYWEFEGYIKQDKLQDLYIGIASFTFAIFLIIYMFYLNRYIKKKLDK